MSLKEKYQQMLEKAKEEVTFYEEMLQLLGRLEEQVFAAYTLGMSIGLLHMRKGK